MACFTNQMPSFSGITGNINETTIIHSLVFAAMISPCLARHTVISSLSIDKRNEDVFRATESRRQSRRDDAQLAGKKRDAACAAVCLVWTV